MNRILDFKVVITSPCCFCSKNTFHKPIQSLERETENKQMFPFSGNSVCQLLYHSFIYEHKHTFTYIKKEFERWIDRKLICNHFYNQSFYQQSVQCLLVVASQMWEFNAFLYISLNIFKYWTVPLECGDLKQVLFTSVSYFIDKQLII